MTLTSEVIDPRTDVAWDNLVVGWPGHSIFHSAAWAKVLTETYAYSPKYLILLQEGRTMGLLPLMEVKRITGKKRSVCLPFSDSCSPLLSQDLKKEDFLNYLLRLGKAFGWQVFDFHGGAKIFKGENTSATFFEHSLELNRSEEELFSRFRDSTRRNIRKAIKEGIRVEREKTRSAVMEYYRLHCMTRKHHGIPPQPSLFFHKIFDHIIANGKGSVFLTYYGSKAIAGAIYLHFGDQVIYKFGASDRRYLMLRANNLVMWEAIKWYCRNGFKRFSFGRTDLKDSGLRQFKCGWGTAETILNYYRYDSSSQGFEDNKPNGHGLSRFVFQKLPIPLLKAVGKLLYKYEG